MEITTQNKALFIGLSALSVGCLIGSFAYPLQKLEIYQQKEISAFNQKALQIYMITENDQNYPYGFQKDKAKLFAQIHHDYKLQKILLLLMACGASTVALSIGTDICADDEINREAQLIKNRGKKELMIEAIKHRMAMASKAQRSLFHEEMKALMEEFASSSIEEEIMEADEINAIYEEQKSNDKEKKLSDNNAQTFRQIFPESVDEASWKLLLKALNNGASKEEIIKDVFQCSDQVIGQSYIEHLKGKFL